MGSANSLTELSDFHFHFLYHGLLRCLHTCIKTAERKDHESWHMGCFIIGDMFLGGTWFIFFPTTGKLKCRHSVGPRGKGKRFGKQPVSVINGHISFMKLSRLMLACVV